MREFIEKITQKWEEEAASLDCRSGVWGDILRSVAKDLRMTYEYWEWQPTGHRDDV